MSVVLADLADAEVCPLSRVITGGGAASSSLSKPSSRGTRATAAALLKALPLRKHLARRPEGKGAGTCRAWGRERTKKGLAMQSNRLQGKWVAWSCMTQPERESFRHARMVFANLPPPEQAAAFVPGEHCHSRRARPGRQGGRQ